ncbi:MAG: hypothetical protein HYV63_14555 [Candidatus Schekmanbacteria bacterium]|nr:hypothetical protein [Candidatus Schekmanbacteria bacterium]
MHLRGYLRPNSRVMRGLLRAVWLALVVGGVAWGAAAARADPGLTAELPRGGTLLYSSLLPLRAYDPYSRPNVASIRLSTLLFESLVDHSFEDRSVVGRLAESFDATPDRITFHLKKGVTWHDGTPLSAADVAFTMDVVRSPQTGSALGTAYSFVASTAVGNDQTITFSFTRPVVQPADYFVPLRILPRHLFGTVVDARRLPALAGQAGNVAYAGLTLRVEPRDEARAVALLEKGSRIQVDEVSDTWIRGTMQSSSGTKSGWLPRYRAVLDLDSPICLRPVGSGPYQLESVQFSEPSAKRYERYHGRPHAIERVVRKRTTDKATLAQHLAYGTLNLATELPYDLVTAVEAGGQTRTIAYPSLGFVGLMHNNRNPWLAKPEVRRALTLAFDRQTLHARFYHGLGEVISGPFSPYSYVWERDPALAPLSFSPTDAALLLDRALMTRAANGARVGPDGNPVTFALIVSAERSTEDISVCEAFADAMKAIGIDVQVTREEHGRFAERLVAGDFDIAFQDWVLSYSYFVKPLFYPNGAQNYIAYKNEALRALWDELENTTSTDEIIAKTRAIWTVLREDCPYTFLWSLPKIAAARYQVLGISGHNIHPYYFFTRMDEWWIRQ